MSLPLPVAALIMPQPVAAGRAYPAEPPAISYDHSSLPTPTRHPKALLRPVCGQCFGIKRDGCTDGISPMYRMWRGPRRQRVAVYRCFGHGPQRSGCGAEILVDELDRAVIVLLSVDMRKHTELVFVAGDDRAEQISRLHDQAADAMRQGDYERSIQCMKDAAELEKQPSARPHWDEVERDITRGQHFASLDTDARREYLAKWRPVARVEDGQVLIDLDAYTDEHGVKVALRTNGSAKPAFTVSPGLAGDVGISLKLPAEAEEGRG